MQTHGIVPPPETLAAILPDYSPAGDCTTLIMADGSKARSAVAIRSIIRRLARERAIDLTALKQQTERATGQRMLHILPLADNLVLVPLKVRIPRVGRDNCTGYVNACCVDGVGRAAAPPYKAAVLLRAGGTIDSLWNAATIERYLRDVRLLTSAGGEPPELAAINRKLLEVFQDILSLKMKLF
ncbi:MAG: hypothetical protein E6X17_10660 [Sporomusaceae bacterium]|nr:hypothetical protein [Sporomusaceae bacterium]